MNRPNIESILQFFKQTSQKYWCPTKNDRGFEIIELAQYALELEQQVKELKENCMELEAISGSWMRDYDLLKAKYEPLVAVESAKKAKEWIRGFCGDPMCRGDCLIDEDES